MSMILQRRRFLRLAVAAVAAPALPRAANAQSYPDRPVRVVVPYAPGGPTDVVTRLLMQKIAEHTGKQFFIENVGGAGGNLGMEKVAHAPGDGYTVLLSSSSVTVNPSLYAKMPFDVEKDLLPVTKAGGSPNSWLVNPDFPAKTVPEFIAYAKANPGKVNMASAGAGGPQHAAGEMFKYLAGVDMVHVPYRGSTPAITDLIGGQVQVMFDVTPTAVPQIKGGKLRALGVSSLTRIPALPDVPPIADTVKGYEAAAWIGIGAPHGTPPDIVALLNKQITASLNDDTIKKRLADLGAEPQPQMAPDAFAKYVADDVARWAKVIKAAGMKPE